MIQRIQSVYLFIAALLGVFLIAVNPNLWRAKINDGNYIFFTGQGDFKYFTLTMVIVLLALVTIFLFKNRKLQLRLTVLNVILSAGLIFLQYFLVGQIAETFTGMDTPGSTSYLPAAFIPIPMAVLFILAARGIYKDEKLIRSSNRFRD